MSNDSDNAEKITAKEELQNLRTEILESEKARIDLLKYKLIAVASLAAIGLGFAKYENSEMTKNADYVLCIIPFVCAYVDLLCYHNTIRILVIACFLNHYGDSYEGYIVKLGNANEKGGVRYFFDMEDLALFWSSIGLSVLLAFYSVIPYFIETNKSEGSILTNNLEGSIFLTAGIVASAISIYTKLSFTAHQKALFSTADKLKKHANSSIDLTVSIHRTQT
jgi:hypothetical protein